jgi:phosphonate transport system substrate-binding protein
MLRRLLTTVTAFWLLLVAPLAANAETIKLAVTDLVGLEELQREFGPFKAELQKATGYDIEFLPVTNRTAALEALRFKKVDFVLAGPAEYVVMKKRAQADVVVGLYRPDYYSIIVVKSESPYFTVRDLKGKPMGMGSVGSTSRHLGPMQLLSQGGLSPLTDVKVTHTNVNVAWEALKKGDLEAIGIGRSDYESLVAKEADKQGLQRSAFRTIARSGDLPNDLLIAGAHVSPGVVKKVRDAVGQHSDTLIAAILQGAEHTKRYKGMRFLTQIADKDYDVVRAMYATAGYPEYSDFIGDK